MRETKGPKVTPTPDSAVFVVNVKNRKNCENLIGVERHPPVE